MNIRELYMKSVLLRENSATFNKKIAMEKAQNYNRIRKLYMLNCV